MPRCLPWTLILPGSLFGWVQPIQYALKQSIYPFITCTDFVNSSLPRAFLTTYNGHIWFQTALYDPNMYPLVSQVFSPPGPVTSKIPQKTCIIAFNFGNFLTIFRPKIKTSEMFTMVPNTLRESNWVCGTIQFALKRSIYSFSYTSLVLPISFHGPFT